MNVLKHPFSSWKHGICMDRYPSFVLLLLAVLLVYSMRFYHDSLSLSQIQQLFELMFTYYFLYSFFPCLLLLNWIHIRNQCDKEAHVFTTGSNTARTCVLLSSGRRYDCLLQLSNIRGGSVDDHSLCRCCDARGKTKLLLGCSENSKQDV